ncbi:hypothetical protein H072_619 [Dactylellina haptotyla CBS 200.50]|uniref:Uncharacterized protein n=1 Tax=Dactylellina haptotyla (strain CBS 200.50) TaxID=1284197 RepID=S8AWM2_DACHA|nr:hypothetical protein H072_619 [Dactylellina haptotyla CBS 200.50]
MDSTISHDPVPQSSPSEGKPYLLIIPPEVRETIYSYLFDLCQLPAEVVGDSTPPDPELVTDLQSQAHVKVFYPNAFPKYTLLPILQSCRKIRAEFQDFLDRLQKYESKITEPGTERRGFRYTLNVQAFRGAIYPSWGALALPLEEPYNIIEELWVNYKVMESTVRNGGRFYGCGGMGYESYGLFDLCNLFYFHGPQGFYIPKINGPHNSPTGELPLDGGRCKPKVKRLVFNMSFEYSEACQKTLESLKRDIAAGQTDLQKELDEHLLSRVDNEYRALSYGVSNWFSILSYSGYFDGWVEKIDVLHDGAAKWELVFADSVNGQVRKATSREPVFFDIPNGFHKNPDWKPSSEYEAYSYRWGPKEHLRRKPQNLETLPTGPRVTPPTRATFQHTEMSGSPLSLQFIKKIVKKLT